MSEYARFDNGTKSGSLYPSDSQIALKDLRCGCLLGWSCMLLEDVTRNDFLEKISTFQNTINFYSWSLVYLGYDESYDQYTPIYDYLFSSIWGEFTSTNTLEFGLERMQNVLEGYKPQDLKDEVKKACGVFGEDFNENKFYNIIG